MMLTVLIVGAEPVLAAALDERLSSVCTIVAVSATGHDALAAARKFPADITLVDADLAEGLATDLIAGLSLVTASPILVLSAKAPDTAPETVQLLAAGATAVLHKPGDALPLDLDGPFADRLIEALHRYAHA